MLISLCTERNVAQKLWRFAEHDSPYIPVNKNLIWVEERITSMDIKWSEN